MIDPKRSLWGGDGDGTCLLTSIAASAAATPDAIALVDENGEYSYTRLLSWAAFVADELRRNGVAERDGVAVTGPRTAATVAAYLGVMTVGATYVPLDPEYPPRRIAHMLSDSGAALVLSTGDVPALADGDTPTLRVPHAPTDVLPWQPVSCDPTLPIYTIYTSGSTGWPKGVGIDHGCLDNMAQWQWRHSPRPRLRTGQFAPLNFDVFFQEVLGSLCGGGTVVVMPESLRRDPMGLLDWIVSHRVERLFMPYVALQMLAVAATATEDLSEVALVEVNTAGEQLVCTPQIREFFTRLPGCRLVNHYGQSESAMVTSHILSGPPSLWPALPPIGVPLPGCEVFIDSSDADPDVGELIVAGSPVSLGYRGHPELNAARYLTVESPRSGPLRAFRTGDLVRLEDGVVQFLTRIDDEVKIRGVRVNLLEIDAWLLDQPGVAQSAAVLVDTAVPGVRVLRAGITVDDGASVDTDALRATLETTLPEVAVPRSITVLDELPRTPSGKIDRDAIARSLR
ncbi:AMP-binding protein [Stackebrandtia soli]|uniref:AMP-binding protein n=1 Tax=Stackebrandtia soli TaxID=1892856 RepID=UPI0039EA6E1A